jgi:hypothetical protein
MTRLKTQMTRALFALMAGVVYFGVSAPALAATTITFDPPEITGMTNLPGLLVPVGSRLTSFYLPYGVKFTSLGGFAAVADHGFPTLTPSAPNILGGTNADGTLNYGAPITISFFKPGNGSVKGTTSSVKILGELFGAGSGSVSLSAFGLTGNLLGTVSDTDNYPLGSGPVLSFSAAGIHSIVLTGTSGTVGYDNLEFANIAAATPEPEAWASMALGLGLAGWVARRRKAKLAAAN